MESTHPRPTVTLRACGAVRVRRGETRTVVIPPGRSIELRYTTSTDHEIAHIVTIDNSNVRDYYLGMLRTWSDREAEKSFNRRLSRRLPQNMQPIARRKLEALNAATTLEDLAAVPGNRLEPLKGNRKGQHSIRINDQWRVCFTWSKGDAYDVEIVDYH